MNVTRATFGALAALAVSATAPQGAKADPIADFYKGKTVTINVGYGVGGGYDTLTRVMARRLGDHIPGNPTIIVQNMPGSGSMLAANHLYNVAPKDGTTLAVFASTTALEPLLGNAQAKFETGKFEWIGSIDKDVNSCGVWKGAGQNIKSLPDIIAAKKTVTFGASSPAASSAQHVVFLKKMFNANVKVITGYDGTAGAKLAMERGEVDAACGLSANSIRGAYMQAVQRGDLTFFVQFGSEPEPLYGNATMMHQMLKSEDDRKIANFIFRQTELAKPMAAPPGTPKDRVAALRKAMLDSIKDPALLAETQKMGLVMAPISGEQTTKMFQEFIATPPELIKKIPHYVQAD
jgi:tripartite-type tricarboxylate transporter receptor subunit TctC